MKQAFLIDLGAERLAEVRAETIGETLTAVKGASLV